MMKIVSGVAPLCEEFTQNTLVSDAIPDPAGLHVFCVDCVSVSKFAVGLEINITDLQLARWYINITVQDFHHDIQLEFSLNDTAQYEKTLDVLLLAIPDLGTSVKDIITIGFFYGAAVRMEMDVSANNLNFTVGASASLIKIIDTIWRRGHVHDIAVQPVNRNGLEPGHVRHPPIQIEQRFIGGDRRDIPLPLLGSHPLNRARSPAPPALPRTSPAPVKRPGPTTTRPSPPPSPSAPASTSRSTLAEGQGENDVLSQLTFDCRGNQSAFRATHNQSDILEPIGSLLADPLPSIIKINLMSQQCRPSTSISSFLVGPINPFWPANSALPHNLIRHGVLLPWFEMRYSRPSVKFAWEYGNYECVNLKSFVWLHQSISCSIDTWWLYVDAKWRTHHTWTRIGVSSCEWTPCDDKNGREKLK
ncbi:hypothetical protein B0H19DRAFT_1073645 [Mycena capillaripes]|nr:hypothetical protein B0H19DRAFT_1073645 [Mycena capillaripes]